MQPTSIQVEDEDQSELRVQPVASDAIKKWRQIVGETQVVCGGDFGSESQSCETASSRRVVARLRPGSQAEIAAIVKVACEYRIPLYPVSTGFNWGYGANLPVTDDCAILDLSRLNRIVDFDAELGTVTLEPGVTQIQLYNYVSERKLPFLVPVTGAGPNCSILGNALERGYGVTPFADHFSAVLSLKAVLPDGRIYRSAHAEAGCEAVDHTFKWGIGPYLDGLFSQGAFGIVTQLTIALARRAQRVEGFMVHLKDAGQLESAVTAIREILNSIGNVTGSINLMNGHRMLAMFSDYPRDRVAPGEVMSDELVGEMLGSTRFGGWNVGGIIYGDRGLVATARRRIRKAFRPLSGSILFFNRTKIDLALRVARRLPYRPANRRLTKQISDLSEAFKVAEGAPTEAALPLCYWKSGIRPPKGTPMNPAADGCGLIWYSPLVPMKPDTVRAYTDMVRTVCIAHGMEPLITLTSLSDRCFDSTVPLLFDRTDPDDTARAKACFRGLFEAGKRLGVYPYRAGIDQMDLVVDPEAPFWDLVSRIKKAVDPQHIISPGRYSPTRPAGKGTSHA